MDITKHKWSDLNVEVMADEDSISLLNRDGWSELNKDDAIAIAKHFDLLDCSSFGAVEPLNESVDIVFTDMVIPQSETTYNSEIGEMKQRYHHE